MNKTAQLVASVIEGIKEKKGNNIVSMDFTALDNSICNYFVICDAVSDKNVKAIANSVEEFALKKSGEKIIYKEGYENSEWILLDYTDVIVHIFQTSFRKFYNIESLWADTVIKKEA